LSGDPTPTLTLPRQREREIGCNDFNNMNVHFQMKRPIVIISIFLALTITLTVAEVIFSKSGASLLRNNILMLTLFNINLILLVVLFLLLSRNVVKFIFDRHQNVLGSKFRTKLIAAFVGFSIIPSILLFIVASGLLTSSINNWFNIQVEKSLKNSLDVAQSYYDKAKGDTLYFKLYDLFCEVSPRTLKNDVLDIVFLRDANLEICFHIIRYGKVLYEKMSQVRLDFEIQTTLLYCDYKPLLEKQDQEILQSL